MATTAYRTTVSLSPLIGKKLQSYRNKSAIIEQSLEIFFERDIFLKKAEKKFWKRSATKKKYSPDLIVDNLVGIMSDADIQGREDYNDHLAKKYL